jgi:hypothetical protein
LSSFVVLRALVAKKQTHTLLGNDVIRTYGMVEENSGYTNPYR